VTLTGLSIAWVSGFAANAPLPVQRHYVSAVLLARAAPVLLVLAGLIHGWIYALLGLVAFISMFRNPLRPIAARLRGAHPEFPA
jgi:cytochrome c oxidase assembly factor CtaG